MVSDAVHSASDVFSSIIVIVGVKLSAQASDKEHPYGHERLECIAALLLANILCLTGIGIGYGAVKNIIAEIMHICRRRTACSSCGNIVYYFERSNVSVY